MWRLDIPMGEESAFLEVMLSVHPSGRRIYDLEDQLYRIVYEERENPITARNFWGDYKAYNRNIISEDIFGMVLEVKLIEVTLGLPKSHIICNRLHVCLARSLGELEKRRSYSQTDIDYVKELGRRLDTKTPDGKLGV